MTAPSATPRLGRLGVWSGELRFSRGDQGPAATKELEDLGWGAAWIPGGFDDKVLDDVDRLLSATQRITIATGILNAWKIEPEAVAAWWRGQAAERQARTLIGVGVSHERLIGADYQRPLAKMRDYLTRLRDAGFPKANLCLAALGPKMLELSAELSAGAHPYLTTPEHTAIARKTIGPDALLAPEQGVVLETDPAKARELARQGLQLYLGLPNYVNNWRRLGFGDEDFAGPSDRLIDALFAWGDAAAISRRVEEHLDAGADHVCLQVIAGPMGGDLAPAQAAWRELAALAK